MSHTEVRLRIDIASFMRVLCVWVGFLVAASSFGQVSTYVLGHTHLFGMVNLFSLDREANVPSWYSSISLLLCGILLAVIAYAARAQGDRWWRHWTGLAAIFGILALDEAASIHELSIEPLRDALGAGGLLHWTWVVPGSIFVLVVGAVYLRFIAALPRRTRLLLIVSAVTFVGGALGLEMLGAAWFDVHGRRNLGYAFFWTVEETLEMCGVLIFIYALLGHLSQILPAGLGVDIGGSRRVERASEPMASSSR